MSTVDSNPPEHGDQSRSPSRSTWLRRSARAMFPRADIQRERGGVGWLFRDRAHAGRELATALADLAGQHALVLGIPRGGVPVAAEIARELRAELDVIVAKKVGAPNHEEVAAGAVTAYGEVVLNRDVLDDLGVSDRWLQAAIAAKTRDAEQRESLLRCGRPAPAVRGRVVILVDDGLATGATARVCARSLRRELPARLILAVPVGSAQACESLADEVDEVVCLARPDPFVAVGVHYQTFEPVSERSVQEVLERARMQTRDR